MFTPSVETGCYIDTIQSLVLQAAKNIGFSVSEVDNLGPQDILQMDEAFIASEAKSMQKIIGIDNKRFIHKKTGAIHIELNKILWKD